MRAFVPTLLLLGLSACIFDGGDGPSYMTVLSVQTSRNADGTVHVSALVQNGGGDDGAADYEGSFCVSAQWEKGATLTRTYGINSWTAVGGTVLGEASACGSSLSAGSSVRLEMTSPQAITDDNVFVVAAFSDHPADTGVIVSSP